MRYLKVVLAAVALISSASAAVSTNGQCGAKYGSCPSGTCCSKFGWCGISESHCGVGCQSKYGKCLTTDNTTTVVKKTTTTTKKNKKNKTTTTTTKKNKKNKTTTTTTKKNKKNKTTTTTTTTTVVKKSTTTTTKKSTPTTVKKISPDGTCGRENGYACPEGKCCSEYGYCGVSKDHCLGNCQSEFGACGQEAIDALVVEGFSFKYECLNKKHWALTFDDGTYDYDMDLLDLLKKLNVKATFFINGDNVKNIQTAEAKKIVKRMYADGHVVASHTWSHANIANLTKDEIVKEMKQLEDVIYKYIGKKPALMRPPYGAGEGSVEIQRILKELGYTAAVKWNVDTNDWKYKGDIDYALEQFKNNLGNSALSLNHNFYDGITKSKLLNLVESEIKFMKKNGYTPVTVDECLGLKAYQ